MNTHPACPTPVAACFPARAPRALLVALLVLLLPAATARAADGPREWLPAPFFSIRLLELELWQWIGLLVLVFVAFALSWFLARGLVRTVGPMVARTDTTFDDRVLEVMARPLRLLIAVWVFWLGMALLSLSAPSERFLGGAAKALTVLAVTWLILRLVDVFSHWASDRLTARGQAAATAFLPIGRRVLKVILGGLAAIAMLQNFGVNVTGLLAGIGLGGLAVALAAQRTVENVFGAFSVSASQPVRVGDFCRFGDRVGTVEDIGLYATRIRTLDRTVVSIPNSEFSQMKLENFAKRDRIWLHTVIGLRYETTPDQLRHVIVELRRLLLSHPKIDRDPARIRFVSFGAYSLDLEVFAYVLTSDINEFLAVREDVFLRVMDVVAESGTGFAFPSQTSYLARDEGVDQGKGRAAEEQVRMWRAKGELCLPDFPEEAIAGIDDTLDYPPKGSAVRAG